MSVQAQTLHDQLVRYTVAEMKRQQMTAIKADHYPGYAKPNQIGEFIPDAVGYFNCALVIVEAESSEGLLARHTEQQFSTFYNYARSNGGYFIVSVSNRDVQTAEALIRKICGQTTTVLIWSF